MVHSMLDCSENPVYFIGATMLRFVFQLIFQYFKVFLLYVIISKHIVIVYPMFGIIKQCNYK